jgi:hypothetical protein
MLINTVGLRFTPSSRPVGGLSPSSPAAAFPTDTQAQAALSLRAFPANPTYPLGTQMLSTLLELQAKEPDDGEVDENGSRKENPDQPRDKKHNNRSNT